MSSYVHLEPGQGGRFGFASVFCCVLASVGVAKLGILPLGFPDKGAPLELGPVHTEEPRG